MSEGPIQQARRGTRAEPLPRPKQGEVYRLDPPPWGCARWRVLTVIYGGTIARLEAVDPVMAPARPGQMTQRYVRNLIPIQEAHR